jgi:hypothetical protein
MRIGNAGGLPRSGPEIKRPLQTIGCSGRLTTATLPILTKERTVANLMFRLTSTQMWGDVSAAIFR